MMTNTNSFGIFAAPLAFESRAVRAAKAQFTLAPTTPPWRQPADRTPESVQLSAIRRMSTIIDTKASLPNAGSPDVQTAFTTYKALDRLKLLATAATRTGTSDAQRKVLEATFAKGMADLQAFLGQAPTDKLELSFGLPTRRATTVSVARADPTKFTGTGILKERDAPLPGITGTEKLRISLNKPGASDEIVVDLAQTPQPPTLDSVSDAINAEIEKIQLRNPDGSVVLDDSGNPRPRWLVRFVPDKSSGQWGFSVKAPNGLEQVSIDQVDAADSLVAVSGQAALGQPVATQVLRFTDTDDAMTRSLQGTISAIDTTATAQAKLVAPRPAPKTTAAPITVMADTTSQAIATDAAGFSYVVGTTSGDLQSNRSSGKDDLFLTKLDSEGKTVWQRSLGAAGGAQGAAVTISASGDILVAGTVNGSFDGQNRDGDMIVARFSSQGDERFATVIPSFGADTARALVLGNDGQVFVGGRAAGNGGDAFLARLDSTGKLVERRRIDNGGSESITALTLGQDGNLLALMNQSGTAVVRSISSTDMTNDLGSLTLGVADARAIAVAEDGSIAVVGATTAAIAGTQVNAASTTSRDGFVTRIDSNLSTASTTYLSTSGDDQVDSIAFMNGSLFVGGRTTGDLGGALRGAVDGFVSRIDAVTGIVQATNQFGQAALRTEPVRIAASEGGDNILGALGLRRGVLNPPASESLVAQTSLRAGDEFSLRVQGGPARKIVIQADDTLTTLADRIRRITGSKAKVATSIVSGSMVLNIDATAGSSVALVAGAPGKDALTKLGLDPSRLAVPILAARGAPKVMPGGNFGLALTEGLNVSTREGAAATLTALNAAISTTQTAYRSMYWDAGKAALTDGVRGSTALTAAQAAQLDNYKSALARLTPAPETTFNAFFSGF
ncbi:hypothetical protein [Sphingomonas sp. 37zxx]|uniref:hypothetical protein n=1 Tax=Sphingomonas sp. 37zxx TaxID=1550073 RepID=UPI001E3D423A|nr:hypothetical protein [Sphingomonas sp. 37zxx]